MFSRCCRSLAPPFFGIFRSSLKFQGTGKWRQCIGRLQSLGRLLQLLSLLSCSLSSSASYENHPHLIRCDGMSDGRLLSYPGRCELFIECGEGRTFVRECGPSLYFNEDKGVCDYRHLTNCKQDLYSVFEYVPNDRHSYRRLDVHPSRPHPGLTPVDGESLDLGVHHSRTRPADPVKSLEHLNDIKRRQFYDETVYEDEGRGFVPLHTSRARESHPTLLTAVSHREALDENSGLSKTYLAKTLESIRSYCSLVMGEAKAGTVVRLGRELLRSGDISEADFLSPFRYVANFLNSRPYAKTLSKSAIASLSALKLVKQKFGLSHEDLYDVLVHQLSMTSMLRPLGGHHRPDTTMPDPLDVDYCPYPLNYDCEDFITRRSIEGSCNNLKRPIIGRSMTPFRRLVPTIYADGIEEPRRSVVPGHPPLPGARFVSGNLFSDINVESRQTTMTFVFFGQFTDHDFTRTALTMILDPERGPGKTKDLKCGTDGCQTGEGLEACMPIPVPEDDPDFPYNRCLMFVRNMEVPHLDCNIAPREQLNQVTHWLDGSQVYGSTIEEARALRNLTDKSRGRLGVVGHPHGRRYKPLLPREMDPNSMCHSPNSTHFCFLAGDPRVNENCGLGIIHIVWVRQHNLIEAELHRLNPHWNGETLFEESRRIVIALLQHITFNEWIPLLLGPDAVVKHGLALQPNGYYTGYDDTLDGRMPNAFVAAAFRIGHTLLNERLNRVKDNFEESKELFLSETFNRPVFTYDTAAGGVDSFIRGLSSEPSQTFDIFFTKQVTRSLFSDQPPHGSGHDLLSLNIQRARDHGLGTYNDYREYCGMTRARTFEDLTTEIPDRSHRNRLRQVYKHVDDIDLFAGGVYERSVEGGIAGPTFACIIGQTFRHARKADRFWYENEEYGFTPAQLHEIRKITFSRILCVNSDRVHTIQPYVFLRPGSRPIFAPEATDIGDNDGYNLPVPCDSLPRIDWIHFRQGPYTN